MSADTKRLLAMVSHAYASLPTYNEQMELSRHLKTHVANLNRTASTTNGIARSVRDAEKKARKAAKAAQQKAEANEVEQEATA